MFEQYPKEFGPYMLLEKIGQGGMAEIFRAENTGPQGFAKEVAIKRILTSLASNEDFITQFLDEARIVGNLSHPNIVQIYDVGQVDEAYYIAMEYVHGKHLGQVIQKAIETMSQFPIREAIAAINEVSKALAFAHNAVDSLNNPLHIIHRDVSPQNVLVGFNGVIKLTDFGIAKAANKLFQTTAGVIKGKFSYLAPEQLVGKGASTASDIFSLGVAFWEMLSGRRLFQGESDIRTIQLVQACQVPPLSQFRNDVPPELEQIITYMLSPSPEYRYQNAYDLVNALSHVLLQYGISDHLNLVANFMGSLHPEAFQQNNGALPTRASIPAISEHEAAQHFGGSSPAESFTNVPTMMLNESQQSSENGLQEETTSPLESEMVLGHAPTLPLDSQNIQKFLSPQQEPQQHSAPHPSSIDIPSAVGAEMHVNQASTAPVTTLEEEDGLATDPSIAQINTYASSSTTKGGWKTLILLCLILGFLGGGVGFGYIYYKKRQKDTILPPPLRDTRATIQIMVNPPNARVTLNGQLMEGTAKRVQKGLIGGIKYRVKAVLKGYKTEKRRVELKDGETYKLKLTMIPDKPVDSND